MSVVRDEKKSLAWFCVRTKTKSEHLAAGFLNTRLGIETFCPRIRYQKATRRGKIWYQEAMFPGYIFARFDYSVFHRAVNSANGVTKIVSFGSTVPTIGTKMIHFLKMQMEKELLVFHPNLRVGSEVKVIQGPFIGVSSLVTSVLPAKDRVKILLEILGQETEVEVGIDNLVMKGHPMTTTVFSSVPSPHKKRMIPL